MSWAIFTYILFHVSLYSFLTIVGWTWTFKNANKNKNTTVKNFLTFYGSGLTDMILHLFQYTFFCSPFIPSNKKNSANALEIFWRTKSGFFCTWLNLLTLRQQGSHRTSTRFPWDKKNEKLRVVETFLHINNKARDH